MSEQSRKVATPSGSGLAAWLLAAACTAPGAYAALLPDSRADVQYHVYDGGGVRVDGPAVLFRKGVRDDFSLAASFYRDQISGASPDVLATASPYSDERNEYGFGVDYLRDNSVMSVNYLASSETDYDAQLFSLGVAHDVFGGMTTFKMGFGRGEDTVSSNTDASFEEGIDRFNYTLGISQVLSRSLLMGVDYETISDEGYLGSPYRNKRVLGVFAGPEVYPETRTSNAVSLRALKSWTPNASTLFGYRYFWDSWDIQAHTWEAGYSNQLHNGWLVDLYYRYYTQERASFYSDDFEEELNYMARDKELSTFASNTLGAKFTYPVFRRTRGITHGTLNFSYEIIDYNYDDYSDASSGSSNPYSFSADSLHLYFSIWY
jgi:hypothetical protein